MTASISIGLIGDYNAAVLAHQAIPRALDLAGGVVAVSVRYEWVPTPEIGDESRLRGFDGLWCVPASPYRSMDGSQRTLHAAIGTGRHTPETIKPAYS